MRIRASMGNVAKQRSWPLVLVGAVVALAVGALVWVVWLAPGQPTVDQPVATASASPSPQETSEQTPSATPTGTPTLTASPTPTDEVDNPIDDAIVGYPGSPIKPSAVARDVVRIIQQRIVDLGTKLTVDGVYGTRTTAMPSARIISAAVRSPRWRTDATKSTADSTSGRPINVTTSGCAG